MTFESAEDERFSRDELGGLIATATRLDQLNEERGLTLDEVRGIASEVGVSDSSILEAVHAEIITRRAARQQDETEVSVDHQTLRRRLASQAGTYVTVISGLAAVDFIPDQGFDWVGWPAAGWGVAIAIQAVQTFFGDDEQA